jgi:hypothetical protein
MGQEMKVRGQGVITSFQLLLDLAPEPLTQGAGRESGTL